MSCLQPASRVINHSSSASLSLHLLRAFSTTRSCGYPRQVQFTPYSRAALPDTKHAPPPAHAPDTSFKHVQPMNVRQQMLETPPNQVPYPSPLNAYPKVYRKPQRREWRGHEEDYPAAPVGRPQDNMAVNLSSEIAKQLNLKGNEKPAEYFVKRTAANGFLPVYIDYKSNDRAFTVVRCIEGNSYMLLDRLLRHLTAIRPDVRQGAEGRVSPSSGEIEIKGKFKTEVQEWLLAHGF